MDLTRASGEYTMEFLCHVAEASRDGDMFRDSSRYYIGRDGPLRRLSTFHIKAKSPRQQLNKM